MSLYCLLLASPLLNSLLSFIVTFVLFLRGLTAKFDRDFSRAISRLSRDIAGELRPDDHGPDAAALAFRSRFGALGM